VERRKACAQRHWARDAASWRLGVPRHGTFQGAAFRTGAFRRSTPSLLRGIPFDGAARAPQGRKPANGPAERWLRCRRGDSRAAVAAFDAAPLRRKRPVARIGPRKAGVAE